MKILVLHIPKTGGTAVARYLKIFGENILRDIITQSNILDFEKYKYNIVNEYSFIQGHVLFPLNSMIDSIKEFDFVISVVRDPFSRVKSRCNYIDHPHFPDFFSSNYLNNVSTRNEQCGYVVDQYILFRFGNFGKISQYSYISIQSTSKRLQGILY